MGGEKPIADETAPERPKVGPVGMLLEVLAAAGIAVCALVVLKAWPGLPAEVPSHFGFGGSPDDWSGRGIVWLTPAVALVLYVLLTVVRLYPKAMNYPVKLTPENTSRQYALAVSVLGWLKAEVAWTFAYLSWTEIRVAEGRAAALGAWFLPVVLVVVGATVGGYLVMALRRR